MVAARIAARPAVARRTLPRSARSTLPRGAVAWSTRPRSVIARPLANYRRRDAQRFLPVHAATHILVAARRRAWLLLLRPAVVRARLIVVLPRRRSVVL